MNKINKENKILIASDHGGFDLKEHLIQYLKTQNYNIVDMGTYNRDSVDYPDYAEKVAEGIIAEENVKGILVCGTGIGISIAANKHKGIRAALVGSVTMARLSREHNNANIVCLGGRTTGSMVAEEIVETFLNTEFEGDRHQRRIDMLEKV